LRRSRQGYVQGSPVALAYYNNIMSTIALVPVVFLTGEVPGVMSLLMGEARTFFWGALITVSGVRCSSPRRMRSSSDDCLFTCG